MKLNIVVVGLMCLAAAFVFLTLTDSASITQTAETAGPALPASLDNFYPPNSPAPVYLLAMLDLAKPLSGIVCDVFENDPANAQSQFKAFKKAYLEVSNMVPEWKQEYPLEPVEKLEKALAAGDPSKIMPAMEEMGKVCHNCHRTTMAPVQQMYRWNRFDDLVIADPLSGQDGSFANLMLLTETSFTGIGVDLEQGQPENARKQFAGFKARFETVTDACVACHDSERRYFVDSDITDMISRLKLELDKKEINPKAVGDLMQSIGQESCGKCHLVHVPAAYAQQTVKGGKH